MDFERFTNKQIIAVVALIAIVVMGGLVVAGYFYHEARQEEKRLNNIERSAYVAQCKAEAEKYITPNEAKRYCMCMYDSLAADKGNKNIVQMTDSLSNAEFNKYMDKCLGSL